MFHQNSRVVLKNDPDLSGLILYVHDLTSTNPIFDVRWDNGQIETVPGERLALEVVVDAWTNLATNNLLPSRDFSNANIFFKVRNTTKNTISSLRASRTSFKPYQFKPLLKFLSSDLKRLLIADEVGLGKTIEAGHILIELMARGQLKNALVVCPKPLVEKWKNELRTKFNLDFDTFHSVNEMVNSFQSDINVFQRSVKGIVNYERVVSERFIDLLEQNNHRLDVLICDESHKLKNQGTVRYKAFNRLVAHCDNIIFMTATPITLSIRDLFNQIRLLDKDRYGQFGVWTEDFNVFENDIAMNKPFIQALQNIQKGKNFSELRKELIEAEVSQKLVVDEKIVSEDNYKVDDLYNDDPLYERAMHLLLEDNPTHENRVRVANDLSELNSLNYIYSRSRKREVLSEEERIHREPITIPVTLNKWERSRYERVMDLYDSLAAVTRKRQVTSSIIGYETPREELLNGAIDYDVPDSKFKQLLTKVITKVVDKEGNRLILFSTFINTLIYLKLKLDKLGYKTEIIHGQVQDKDERISSFRNNSDIKILLSSEVGSEGLDLQFCNTIVNYDLPWNPMVVEQRIGRIDRVGQESSIIHIYTMVIHDSIEEDIYNRLLSRINIFRESLGDLESILSEEEDLFAQVRKMEDELYMTRLPRDQVRLRIDEVALAIEREKLALKDIRDHWTDAIASDIHFKQLFDEIQLNSRFITKSELIKYVKSFFDTTIPRIRLTGDEEVGYKILIPEGNKELFDIIEHNIGNPKDHTELHYMFRQFKTKYYSELEIPITFDQDAAFRNPSIELISSYHPIVISCTNILEKTRKIFNQAYRIKLLKSDVSEPTIEVGMYLIVIFKISVSWSDRENNLPVEYLRSITANLNGKEVEFLEEKTSDKLMSTCAHNAHDAIVPFKFTEKFVEKMRTPISTKILQLQSEIEVEENWKVKSSRHKRIKMESYFFENQINRRKQQLLEGRGLAHILEGEIKDLEARKANRLEVLAVTSARCAHTIISVNYLSVE